MTKKKFTSRQWLKWIAVCMAIVLGFMAVLMFVVDPYFQFRIRDNTYLLNPKYVNGGLIKNYDYDTLIIGSSMTQNFDMDLFRQQMGVKPLHISLDGMCASEMTELMQYADNVGKAETYYACIDIWSLMAENANNDNISYLMSDSLWAKAQYLLSHEAWFYSLPVDTALLLLKTLGVDLPASVQCKTSIDDLGNWERLFVFGEESVLSNYVSGHYAVSEVDSKHALEIARENIDQLISAVDTISGSVAFFFPPYSGLFWHSKAEELDIMLAVKRYFVETATNHGYVVHDFQAQPFIADLNNYRDITHYSGEINDWMVACFAQNLYVVSPETFDSYQDELLKYVDITVQTYYSDLYPVTHSKS